MTSSDIFRRCNYDLGRHVFELTNVMTFYAPILNLENP